MSDEVFDWPELLQSGVEPARVVDSRRRLKWIFAGFVLAAATVLARATWLEMTTGALSRELAAQPLTRDVRLPARRGSIVAHDGTTLAEDRETPALAIHYRYLETPPNVAWLRQSARARLTPIERRDPSRMKTEIGAVLAEREAMHRRLAELTGYTPQRWNSACRAIQTHVERIASNVHARQRERFERTQREVAPIHGADADESFVDRWLRNIQTALEAGSEPSEPAPIIVAEELDYHVVVEDLPAGALAELTEHCAEFPGARLTSRIHRVYPQQALAAHVVGHLGAVTAEELRNEIPHGPYHRDDLVGRLGLERAFESRLRGEAGLEVQRVDRRGQVHSSRIVRSPRRGDDLRLSIDPAVQQAAERLLDSALAQRLQRTGATDIARGGAVVVLDCHTGAVLASASAPRFEPAGWIGANAEQIDGWLHDANKPLFDRVSRMALPPGSTMKLVTAAALVEEWVVRPGDTFHCQGYLRDPSELRCALFRHFGVGHEEITLDGALAASCNVYFFHHATRLGPDALAAWARRFGLGERTGIELPDEAAGHVPSPRSTSGIEGDQWRDADTQSFAIGQSTLTATPLQIARVAAAIANGGRLVTPHLLEAAPGDASIGTGNAAPRDLRLHSETLRALRKGMERAVSDPIGTAYTVLRQDVVSIAAKSGSAETGAGREDHAWMVAYAPADAPRVAIVAVLEHAGSGPAAAGPIIRKLALRMHELGHFERVPPRVAYQTHTATE